MWIVLNGNMPGLDTKAGEVNSGSRVQQGSGGRVMKLCDRRGIRLDPEERTCLDQEEL